MTVRQISETMDSREFAEWKAISRYYEPFGDDWRRTALLITAVLAPYLRKDKMPKPTDFMPIAEIPQSPDEAASEIRKLIEMSEAAAKWQAQQDGLETLL